MSTRNELNALKAMISAEQKAFDEVHNTHWDRHVKLKQQEHALVRRVILEENLLNLCVWHIHQSTSQTAVYFWLGTDSMSDEVKPLAELAETDYHSSFILQEEHRNEETRELLQSEINLRFDDGEIKIVFDDKHDIHPFIMAWGVKVDLSDLDKRIAETQEVVDQMWDLRRLVK